MSRKRNRGVKTLPTNNLLLEFPLPFDKQQHNTSSNAKEVVTLAESNCFGETIKDKNGLINNYNYYSHNYPNTNLWSSGDTIDTITVGVNNVSLSKSSSSSLSYWSDEYDYNNESSRKIQMELEKIERILCGVEDVPPYYDEDEFRQWMETFPFLSILGKKIEEKPITKPSNPRVSDEEIEEIFAIHPELSGEKTHKNSKQNENKRDIKKAVIDKFTRNASNRLLKQSPDSPRIKKDTKPFTNQRYYKNSPTTQRNFNKNNNKLKVDLEVNDYLKISPVLQRKSLRKRNSNRQHSSKSLVNSQFFSTNWLKEEQEANSPEYNSLPFLSEETQENLKKKKTYRRRNKNTLILPPIEANNLFSNNYGRSISAIPIQQNKSLSAFSLAGKKHLSEETPTPRDNTVLGKNIRELRNFSRIPLRLKKSDSVDS